MLIVTFLVGLLAAGKTSVDLGGIFPGYRVTMPSGWRQYEPERAWFVFVDLPPGVSLARGAILPRGYASIMIDSEKADQIRLLTDKRWCERCEELPNFVVTEKTREELQPLRAFRCVEPAYPNGERLINVSQLFLFRGHYFVAILKYWASDHDIAKHEKDFRLFLAGVHMVM